MFFTRRCRVCIPARGGCIDSGMVETYLSHEKSVEARGDGALTAPSLCCLYGQACEKGMLIVVSGNRLPFVWIIPFIVASAGGLVVFVSFKRHFLGKYWCLNVKVYGTNMLKKPNVSAFGCNILIDNARLLFQRVGDQFGGVLGGDVGAETSLHVAVSLELEVAPGRGLE